MRYPSLQGRRDKGESAIIAALEAAGATVEQIPTGRGVPDLLVGFNGVNYLLEVKTPGGKLNDKQVAWHGNWAGQRCVVRSPEEAVRVIADELCYTDPEVLNRIRKAGL